MPENKENGIAEKINIRQEENKLEKIQGGMFEISFKGEP